MNLTIVSILFCFTASAFALSNNIRNDSDYLIYEPKIIKDETKSPELKIFANPDLSGNPVIEIDEKGLSVEGTLVCTFDKAEPTYFRSLKSNSVGCKDYPPIHSENYDSVGAGTFLAIYVEGFGTSKYFEVKYKSKSAYLDKQNLSDFKYYISKEKERKNKRTEENRKFQQVLAEDTSLVEYIKL